VASGRMRFAMGLTVLGAVLFIAGLLMVVVGEALRLKSGHGGRGIAGTGEFVAFCGLGIGVALLVALAVSRPDRRPAGRARGGRARVDRADGARGGRRRPAADTRDRSARRRDRAQEWLGPLRTAGAGVVPQHVPPSWPDSAGGQPGADDYADDGWHPNLDQEWSPGPAYVWSPAQEDGWDNGADGAWDHVGDQDWNLGRGEDWDLGQAAGITAWPQAHLAGPEPGYGSDRDAEYAVAPEAGYQAVGPVSGAWVAPNLAANSETEYPWAEGTDISEADRAREGHDTSRVPVIRDAGQPPAQPRASEPVPAPQPFSVWERASKPDPAHQPEPVPNPEPFSVWEPGPKRGQQRDRDGRTDDAYRPAHAEPSVAHAQEKIEQIKDLYLTAEAIGEDALSRHFDELRQRQRSLISEFFENAGLGTKDTPTLLGDDPAQDGASLPG
jgi:antitoxin (DNA-binding transcriptional repressor) of toxin-antitoxin stability system